MKIVENDSFLEIKIFSTCYAISLISVVIFSSIFSYRVFVTESLDFNILQKINFLLVSLVIIIFMVWNTRYILIKIDISQEFFIYSRYGVVKKIMSLKFHEISHVSSRFERSASSTAGNGRYHIVMFLEEGKEIKIIDGISKIESNKILEKLNRALHGITEDRITEDKSF